MTEFVSQTINDLEGIIELLRATADDDLETIKNISLLLVETHRSLNTGLNHKIMQDASKEAALLAFISNLDRQVKEEKLVLTVL